MESERGVDEIVMFELPSCRTAKRLWAELSRERLAWLETRDGNLVGALLSPDVEDFAHLLRDVQAWLGRAELAAIRFEADGRTYALHAAQGALADRVGLERGPR